MVKACGSNTDNLNIRFCLSCAYKYTYWQDPCFYKYLCVSRDSHTRQQCPDFYQPKLNHWDSRRALGFRIHIPSTYHSIERPPRPCSLLSRGRPVVFVPPLPTLGEYQCVRSVSLTRQRPVPQVSSLKSDGVTLLHFTLLHCYTATLLHCMLPTPTPPTCT